MAGKIANCDFSRLFCVYNSQFILEINLFFVTLSQIRFFRDNKV